MIENDYYIKKNKEKVEMQSKLNLAWTNSLLSYPGVEGAFTHAPMLISPLLHDCE
jgi:hypothetical protein